LGGLVVATGKTFDDIKKAFLSALKFHIQGCIADGDALPKWLQSGNYELEYQFSAAALLHRLDGIVTRSAIARATGINQKQISHYASGYRKPRPAQRKRIVNGIHHISNELASVV